LVWVKSAGGGADDLAAGVAALSDGTGLVTGTFRWTATFGRGEPAEAMLTAASKDMFVARYQPSGELGWARRAGGNAYTEALAIAALPDGTAFVTGRFENMATFGAGEERETTLIGPNWWLEIFVARYDPSGALAWARHAEGGNYDDWGNSIAVLPDGSAIATGHFREDLYQHPTIFDLGGGVMGTLEGSGTFVARYAP